jgi:mevalonate kinase
MISAALGKVILLGEHAVVHGHPALAAALDRGLRVNFEGQPSGPIRLIVPHWNLTAAAGDGSPVGAALERLARGVGADHLSVDLHAVAELAPGAGLGSSAALMVAATRALAAAAGRTLETRRIIEIALDGERVFHGNPSGVDVTLAARGGVGLYTVAAGFAPLAAPPLPLVIGLSGEPRRTGDMVARVQARLDAGGDAADRLARLGQAARDGAAALTAGDRAGLGALFRAAHGELAALGVSSRGLDLLVDAADRAGALGAKLTGAGGGGAVIALAQPGREAQLVAAWRALGREAFVVTAGAPAP